MTKRILLTKKGKTEMKKTPTIKKNINITGNVSNTGTLEWEARNS